MFPCTAKSTAQETRQYVNETADICHQYRSDLARARELPLMCEGGFHQRRFGE